MEKLLEKYKIRQKNVSTPDAQSVDTFPQKVGSRPLGDCVGGSRLGGEFGRTSVSRCQARSTARSRPAVGYLPRYHCI